MKTNKYLALLGLKWNPFTSDIPVEALVENENISHFVWKIENLVLDGGFAMITGDPGTGKSVILRIINEKLRNLRDVKVGCLTRPQSGLGDFYRELGNLFDIELKSSNRYGGYKALRERWNHHLTSTLFRPILLIDEAQEMPSMTMSELRLLASVNFDSQSILTVIFCGDRRLPEKFRSPELIPLGSRIRTRYITESQPKTDLAHYLKEAITRAGNPGLLTSDLIKALSEHAAGNYRILTTMAAELLAEGIVREKSQLDEQLFFEIFQPHKQPRKTTSKSKG